MRSVVNNHAAVLGVANFPLALPASVETSFVAGGQSNTISDDHPNHASNASERSRQYQYPNPTTQGQHDQSGDSQQDVFHVGIVFSPVVNFNLQLEAQAA